MNEIIIIFWLIIAPVEQNSHHKPIQGYHKYDSQLKCQEKADRINDILKRDFIAYCKDVKNQNRNRGF